MLVLALESSAKTASCAVCRDDTILSSLFLNTGYTHSTTLLSLAKSALELAGVDIGQIELFAVTNGPGSFTGVRIGVSLMKGLAFEGDKPCVGVSTLECIANPFYFERGIVCAAMDARCGQVYNALFRADGEAIRRITPDRAISVAELKSELLTLNEHVILAGDGAVLCRDSFGTELPLSLPTPEQRLQSAAETARIAINKYEVGEFVSASMLIPTYLRPSQAERMRSAGK